MARGFYEIGIFRPRHDQNVGTLYRSAYQLGAAGVFIIGTPFKRQSSDTCHADRHIPVRQFETWEQFVAGRPEGSVLVAVESPEYGGRWLSKFTHPERACYVLGSESAGLPRDIVKQCQHVISIESLRQPSYNVAVAGSLVMYHRLTSHGVGGVMSNSPRRDELEREILTHRYLYYVLCRPILSDYQYDRMESRAKRMLPEDSPVHNVGSDCAADYPEDVVEYAKTLLNT